MSGTSAAPGYLIPTNAVPLDATGIGNLLQQMVVGLTGLDPTLVRPRWQSQPPTQPSPTTDWCSIGVASYVAYDFPEIIHIDDSDQLYRLERINILASFYGPNSSHLSGLMRDGIYIAQSYYVMSAAGLKLRGVEDIIHLPELINAQFIDRADLPMTFMRLVERTYPVLDILSAVVSVTTDTGLVSVETISDQ